MARMRIDRHNGVWSNPLAARAEADVIDDLAAGPGELVPTGAGAISERPTRMALPRSVAFRSSRAYGPDRAMGAQRRAPMPPQSLAL